MSELEPVQILLVEDSEADAELTRRALDKKGLGGHVTWVKDGEEALEFLYRRGRYANTSSPAPKLILLDLKMPKVSGLDVLRRVKSDAGTKAIPVVMLSSSAEESDLQESYELGVNSYVVKPVQFDQFLAQISAAAFYWSTINRVPRLI